MSDQRPEGDTLRAYTVRLELVDEPGELLGALAPIAENSANLLSIFHERGSLTPRGRIPVEVDIEATPERFDAVVASLQETGVNVIEAGAERYSEELIVLLVGALVDTDLSDTLSRIERCSGASVADIALSAPEGTDDDASARLRLATETGEADRALATVREVAAEKEFQVVSPLASGGRE